MAIQISGTNVIDNSRNLTNIESFDSTVRSIWDTVTTTAVSKTLVNRENCTVTAAGQIIVLPASPSPGWEVIISVQNFYDTILSRNGSNIMGIADDIIIDTSYSCVYLTYINSTIGWRIS
jgi:hypothetical protein